MPGGVRLDGNVFSGEKRMPRRGLRALDEPFPGRGFERIDATSGEWSGIPAGTFLWALVTVSTVGLLTAMLIATIAIAA
jgi:hypothetical protein